MTRRARSTHSRRTALPTAQHWLVGAIAQSTTPTHIATHLGGAAVPAKIGLGIYRHAYRARLVDCLADDYPALRLLIGVEAFTRLAHAVIATHPPRDMTLNRYGRWLPRFLQQHPDFAAGGRLAYDLARLEWALVTAIHAPLVPPLDVTPLHNLPAKQGNAIRLVPVPSLTVIRSRWPINNCYRQYFRDETVTIPEPEPCAVAVLRSTTGLERHVFTPAQATLLTKLMRGLPLGKALRHSRLEPQAVQQTLASFLSAGCIARIIVPTRVSS